MMRPRRPPPIDLAMNGESFLSSENRETRELLAPEHSRTLKGFLSRNQLVVSLLQYASTACVMFIPASFRYYEMAAEGCYSLSQLINYFNRVVIESALEKCSKLEDVCVLLTRGISHVEVLIEKGASALIGSHGRTQAIMVVECLKSCLRVLIIINRRAPSLMIHWERNRRPDDPKLDVAHYARWYRLTYAHHVTGGRSSDAIIDAHTGVVTELPPMADATRASENGVSHRQLDRAEDENGASEGSTVVQRGGVRTEEAGGDEGVVLTGPIVGRRSGINIRALRIPKPAASSALLSPSNDNTTNNPDFGIYDNLNPQRQEDYLPLAQPVQPAPRADADDGFRYLPHSVSPLSGEEVNHSSPDTDTEERSSSQTGDRQVGSGGTQTSGRDNKTRDSPSAGGFFSFFSRRRAGRSDSESSDSSSDDKDDGDGDNDGRGGDDGDDRGGGGSGDSGSDGGRDDTFDRDMYVALGGSRNYGGNEEDAQDDEAARYDTPRKPPRGPLNGDTAATGQAPADGDGDGAPRSGLGPNGGDESSGRLGGTDGGDFSHFLNDSLESGLSAERCIYLGELLYVLRPALYAWAVHFVGTHTSHSPAAMRGAGAGTGTRMGSEQAYDSDDDDDWAASPAPKAPPLTPAPALRRASEEDSSNDNTRESGDTARPAPTPGAAPFLPAFAAALDKAPVLAYIANDAHDLQRAVGVIVSFLVEVLSVQLTARGLYLCRARGAQAYHRASPHAEVDPRVTLKAITTLYPHSFDSELSRRRTALFFYLIRTPIFDKATLPLLQLASRMLSRIPLISSIPEHVIGMLSYLNRTHFYSSASN